MDRRGLRACPEKRHDANRLGPGTESGWEHDGWIETQGWEDVDVTAFQPAYSGSYDLSNTWKIQSVEGHSCGDPGFGHSPAIIYPHCTVEPTTSFVFQAVLERGEHSVATLVTHCPELYR